MEITPIIKGAISFIPGSQAVRRLRDRRVIGSKATAEHAYNVWLMHLTLLAENGSKNIPRSVAEIGPGGSLGVGYAALLTGAERYSALDVIHYVDWDRDLALFDGLVKLLRQRDPVTYGVWIGLPKYLDDQNFPSHILTDDLLRECLSEDRVASIRQDILAAKSGDKGKRIKYFAPWDDPDLIDEQSVDLIVSQSVLEHVSDLDKTYDAMTKWLRPSGWVSHSIDYRSHGITKQWNGHLAYSAPVWNIVIANKPCFLNRTQCSHHDALTRQSGFDVKMHLKKREEDRLDREQLAEPFQHMDDDDLTCAASFLQARLN